MLAGISNFFGLTSFFYWLVLFIPIIFCSCKTDIRSEAIFYDLGNKGLKQNLFYEFHPFSANTDTINRYNIFLLTRYTEACEIQTLNLDVEYGSLLRDLVQEKKLTVKFFNQRDQIEGKGNNGIHFTKTLILDSIHYEEGFFVAVKNISDKTNGIISLGLEIEKLKL